MAKPFNFAEYVENNMETWLFGIGSHCSVNHINCSDTELKERLGKFDDETSRIITKSSAFIDDDGGDSVYSMILDDILSYEDKIMNWDTHGNKLELYFDFPLSHNVLGIGYSIYSNTAIRPEKYRIFLSKRGRKHFFIENAFPLIG